MTHEELIAALEAATGPSRELDAEIARCCDARQWRLTDEGMGKVFFDPLEFTASIDAALTLVPETDGNRWYEIGQAWTHATAHVRVYPPNPWEGRTREAVADAPTPAIALCIAALKARTTP